MNITEFLEARITEDESEAGSASVSMHGEIHVNSGDWSMYVLSAERDSTNAQDDFIVKWWPPRVLAECAAKRAIINEHPLMDSPYRAVYCDTCADWDKAVVGEGPDAIIWPCPTLKSLAAVYADHPDYQQEWAL